MEDNNKKITNTGVQVTAFEIFIDAVKADSACALKFMKLPDEKCWFYRANLLVNKERVMVVLDTKARKMDFVGSEIAINSLNDRFIASTGKKPKSEAGEVKAALKPEPINVSKSPNEKTIKPPLVKSEKPLKVQPPLINNKLKPNENGNDKKPFLKPKENRVLENQKSGSALNQDKPLTHNKIEKKTDKTEVKDKPFERNVNTGNKIAGRRPLPPKDPELPDMPYLKTRLTFSEAFGYASKNLEKKETEKVNQVQTLELKNKDIIENKKISSTALKEAENTSQIPPYDGYTVRNYPLKSLERLLKRCEDNDRLTIKNVQTVLEGTMSEVKTYTLTDLDNSKLHVRYLPKKEMIQLQGKKTSLMETVYSFFNDNITVTQKEEVKKTPQFQAKAVELKKPQPQVNQAKTVEFNKPQPQVNQSKAVEFNKQQPQVNQAKAVEFNKPQQQVNQSKPLEFNKQQPQVRQIEAKSEPINNKPFEIKKEVVVTPQTASKQDNLTQRLKAEEREKVKTKEDAKREKLELKELKNKSKEEKANEKEKSETLKKLHKLIPVGFDYLSDIAKKDLCSCLKDINTAVLSDYSGLLTPPYRALENLISSLQLSKGITVKMIGQGFEKEDSGKYILKSGYLKKIDSIIFNEVMSALYTEYFSKRNFFSHSDNSLESQSRDISDKNEVKKIFYSLLEIIEYNCKKLNEIGAKLN